jgi:quercetin dioxygenase-like cupin family protein
MSWKRKAVRSLGAALILVGIFAGVALAGGHGGGQTAPGVQQSPGPIFEEIATGLAQVAKKIVYQPGPAQLDLEKATIPVGGSVPWHCHPGPTAFIMVQGQLTTTNADGTTRVLNPGDADVEQVGVARTSLNTGDVDVILYILFAPPQGGDNTIWLTGPDEKCPLKG